MSRTLVALHAHPDDEALFTGARLALAAGAGVRTVVICLTDGSLGFDPAGRTPLEQAHNRAATAVTRRTEFTAACEVLGVTRQICLGLPDSGMAGWPSAQDPAALCNRDLAWVGGQVADLVAEEGPVTILTYADDGFYGHPDHIATHQVALGAARGLHDVEIEAVVMTTPQIEAALEAVAGAGGLVPEWLGRRLVVPHDPADIVTTIEGAGVADVKQAAVACHGSQLDNQVLSEMDPGLFSAVFGTEHYVSVPC